MWIFFLSRTTAPEIPKFTTKFVNIIKVLNCHNRDPGSNTKRVKLNIEICRENVKKSVSQELQYFNVCDYFAGILKF